VPLLFVLSMIVQFCIGGFTGLMLGALAVNIHVTDTYFVVAHFHYVMFGGAGFALFAAMHYWFPKMFGRMIRRKPAMIGWLLMTVGFNMFYLRCSFSVIWVCRAGITILCRSSCRSTGSRRWDRGFWRPGFSGCCKSFHFNPARGKSADESLGGKTLEWTVPSPPPVENFHEIPSVITGRTIIRI